MKHITIIWLDTGESGYGDTLINNASTFGVRGLSDGNWITTIEVSMIVSDCVLDDGTVTYFRTYMGDPTSSVDTVMKFPSTINYPTELALR